MRDMNDDTLHLCSCLNKGYTASVLTNAEACGCLGKVI